MALYAQHRVGGVAVQADFIISGCYDGVVRCFQGECSSKAVPAGEDASLGTGLQMQVMSTIIIQLQQLFTNMQARKKGAAQDCTVAPSRLLLCSMRTRVLSC